MGTIELFQAFDSRITATRDEWRAAVGRLLECGNALTAHYYPRSSGDHLTIIGSAAKGTAVKPMGDADGVFHMPSGTYHRFDDYAGNGQSALLQEVRGVLAKRYPRTAIRGDGPVVVVEFSTGPNAEIVPGVLISDGADDFHVSCHVPVTRDGGSWQSAQYGAEYENATRLDVATRGQYTRLVRYMKSWRVAQKVTFKSVVIELMAAEFMRRWSPDRHGYVYDDWLVRDFLGYMAENYHSTYMLPTGKRIGTGVGWYEAAKSCRSVATLACDAGEASALYVLYWRKVLGHGFGS